MYYIIITYYCQSLKEKTDHWGRFCARCTGGQSNLFAKLATRKLEPFGRRRV